MMIPKVKVKCNACGFLLTIHFGGDVESLVAEVDPCKRCITNADARGYNRGYSESTEKCIDDRIEGNYA